jgi:hypothetical protein
MTARTSATEFFRAGGTLHPDSPSYITRPADDELFRQIMAGQFCYILTSRQRGKSSLMIRTADRLRRASAQVAIVDLSGIGALVTPEQWYLGFVKRLAAELRLSLDVERWWRERAGTGPVQRFTDFLHDVVLARIAAPVVVFVDEIDSTLRLDFTDDFFAAIRVIYNLRATDPIYDRLTFVLLGVAAPTDLIKDRNRTPFNIGQAIELPEFRREDACALQDALDQLYPGQGGRILDRIFYWTDGHPYLTQRLCLEIAETRDGGWTDERVDQLVERLFLAEDARKESNLQFVHSSVEASPDRRRLLRLYRQVYESEAVPEDERSPYQKRLALIGLVRAQAGMLRVRNQIYRHVFDLDWIKASTPINWPRIASVGAVAVAMIALIAAIAIYLQQRNQTIATQIAFARQQFQASHDADVQLSYLAVICGYQRDREAQDLFFDGLSAEQQRELFEQVKAEEAGDNLILVIKCLHPAIAQPAGGPEGERLTMAMSCSLHQLVYNQNAERLRTEIGYDGPCPKQ